MTTSIFVLVLPMKRPSLRSGSAVLTMTFPGRKRPIYGTYARVPRSEAYENSRHLIEGISPMNLRLVALAALVMIVPAVAETPPEQTTDFVNKVAVANQFEIDTSQLALKYGKGSDVKTFAQQMIDDHTKAGEEFKAALAKAQITPPAEGLDLAHKAKYAKLRVFTTEGGFDASYISAQLEAHKEAVALFKDYAANGQTPAVKDFAAKTLPTLEHHLAMVEQLNSKFTQ
jgi:putative membrane protein